MLAIELIYGALFGAAMGSFLGCAAYRLPRRLSLNGRSHCPSCGVQLKASWNIPLFSWLALRGRTRCCGTPLSPRYLLFEVASAVVGALVAALLGLVLFAVLFVALVGTIALAAALRSRG